MAMLSDYPANPAAAFLLILLNLGRRQNLGARLMVNLGFCRIRFWYQVAQILAFPGGSVANTSGILHCCIAATFAILRFWKRAKPLLATKKHQFIPDISPMDIPKDRMYLICNVQRRG